MAMPLHGLRRGGHPDPGQISRGQGGCTACGIRTRAARRLGDGERAVRHGEADLQPLVPYPGYNKPWRCRCLGANAKSPRAWGTSGKDGAGAWRAASYRGG